MDYKGIPQEYHSRVKRETKKKSLKLEGNLSNITLYHGSPNTELKQLDIAKSYGSGDQYGRGLYLTTDYDEAEGYSKGGKVYKVQLDDDLKFYDMKDKLPKGIIDFLYKELNDSDDDFKNSILRFDRKIYKNSDIDELEKFFHDKEQEWKERDGYYSGNKPQIDRDDNNELVVIYTDYNNLKNSLEQLTGEMTLKAFGGDLNPQLFGNWIVSEGYDGIITHSDKWYILYRHPEKVRIINEVTEGLCVSESINQLLHKENIELTEDIYSDALKHYKATGNYFVKSEDENDKQQVEALSQLIQKYGTVTGNTTLYRKENFYSLLNVKPGEIHDNPQKFVSNITNKVFTPGGFLSTSKEDQGMRFFGLLIEFTDIKETKGLDLSTVNLNVGVYDREKEVLFDIGTSYKITSVHFIDHSTGKEYDTYEEFLSEVDKPDIWDFKLYGVIIGNKHVDKVTEGIHLYAFGKGPDDVNYRMYEDSDYSSKQAFAKDLRANEIKVRSVADNRDMYVLDHSNYRNVAEVKAKLKFYKSMKKDDNTTLWDKDIQELEDLLNEASKVSLTESKQEIFNKIKSINANANYNNYKDKPEEQMLSILRSMEKHPEKYKSSKKTKYNKTAIKPDKVSKDYTLDYTELEDIDDDEHISFDIQEKTQKNESLHKIQEVSRNELLVKAKGETITRYKKADGYKGFSIENVDTTDLLNGNTLTVTCRVGNYDDTVQMEDVLYWIQICAEQEGKYNKERQITTKVVTQAIQNAVDGMDIKVDCTCMDFKCRFAYNATIWGFKYGKPETRPAKIRNPEGFGSICKHLISMLSNKKWLQKVTSVVMDFLVKNIDQVNEFLELKDDKVLTLPNELARYNAKLRWNKKEPEEELSDEEQQEEGQDDTTEENNIEDNNPESNNDDNYTDLQDVEDEDNK